jgi:hypothetical protein
MPITFLDEEEDITPLAPPTKRKITFLDEEETEIAPTTPQVAQPAVTQPSPYKYDPARFRPKGLVAPKAEQEIGTLEGIANAAKNAFDSSRQALDIVGDVTPEEAQNIAKIEFEKQSRKVAPGYDEYQKAEGFDAVLAFAKNPIEVTSNIVAEGLAGSLPALGAGLAAGGVGAAAGSVVPVLGTGVGFTAGQVAGTFAGSLATEYGSKILEEMQSEGVDLTKPESIQGFFENEEAVAKARDKAISRGIPVAAFDAISAGIGGKLGRVIGKQFLTKTGEAAAELGVQAGLGGGGEVAGALVAGEPIEGKAVFGEIIGEAGPGAAEIITGRMADRAARVKAEEEKKIKSAAQLSDNLEQNNAPLTAAAVKSATATTIEQDKLAAQLEEQLDADEIASQVSGQLAVTKEPTAAPPAIKSKEEFAAIYSQVAPEELDAAEAGFTNTLATAATEEARANAQNALEAIKEVKATVTPPAPPVAPTITPAVTPAVPTAQPPITDATQEIIQPEGVRQEPQDRVEGETPAETIARNRIFGAARGQEEGQVATAEPIDIVKPKTPEVTSYNDWANTVQGFLRTEYPELTIGDDPLVANMLRYQARVMEADKTSDPKTWSKEERAAYNAGDYNKFSRLRGYTEGEIREFNLYQKLYDDVRSKYGQQILDELDQPTIGQLAYDTMFGEGAYDAKSERLVDFERPDISPIVGAEPAAIVEQEPVAPVTTPPVTEAVTPAAEQPAVSIPASGKPFEFFSIRNTEKAPRLGTQFGQDVEPSGKYISQSTPDAAKNLDARFEKEAVRFENPLVVEFGGEYGTATNWKNVLSSQYGGKTGKELSQAIRDAGYDGIVTVEPAKGPNRPASTSEIVDISSLKPKKQAATPTPAAPEAPVAEPAGISVGNRIKLGKSPQTYTIEEVIPQSATERELGEQYYSVKNERTGETQVVEARDLKQVKGRGARKIAAAPAKQLSASLESGDFASAQAMVDQGVRMDRSTFLRSITPSATQRATTIHTRLEKDGIISKDEFSGGRGLVYGDGRGAASTYLGSQSYEPFPPSGFSPDYTGDRVSGEGDAINKKFNTILNTFVLNVVDPQTRAFIVKDIGNLLQNGGRAVFVTRGADVANSKALVSFGPLERIQRSEGKLTYQKGFTQQELIQYIQETLGEGFTVRALRGGDKSDVRVEVIKNTDTTLDNPQPASPDIRRQAIDTTPEGILTTPPDQQYTFNEVFDVAYDMFGGEIPEGFTIVNDSKDKDFEFKAAYIPESGEIIVNLAYLNKSDDIRDTITHELGHYIFGDPEFRAAFDQFIASLSPEARADLDAYVETAYNKETGEIRLEEKMVRAFVDQFINEEQAPAWRSMLDAIKRFLNKLGFKFNISDRDAISVFTAALDRYKAGEAISREGWARKIIDDLTAMDGEYLAAVERGDMETAQRMVDEAAKKAGYTIAAGHATPFDFNVFDRAKISDDDPDTSIRGFFFSTQPSEFAAYVSGSAERGARGKTKIINAYLNLGKVIGRGEATRIIKQQLKNDPTYQEEGYSLDDSLYFPKNADTVEFVAGLKLTDEKKRQFEETGEIKEGGKVFVKGNPVTWTEPDGSITSIPAGVDYYTEADDYGPRQHIVTFSDLEEAYRMHGESIYIVRDSNQIKRADPVTYDDAGDVIPLSQRFRPTSPDIRRMAAEPAPKRRKEQVGGAEREETRYITTPKGILSMNTDVLREKFFDGTSVSPEKTTQAWGYISRLLDIKSGNANELAGEINDTVDADLVAKREAAIAAGEKVDPEEDVSKRIGAAMFSVELMNYAGRLAEQGDTRMLKFMIRNVNSMPTDKYAGDISDAARALRTRLEYDVSGFSAYTTEQKAKVDRTAAVMFGTNKPSKEQSDAVKDAIDESEKTELGNAGEVAGEVEKVEKRTKRKITDKIEKVIGKGSLKGMIQAVKDTPLEKQQERGWIEKVVNDFLINAGLSPEAASTASKLYESLIAERFAAAKQKAFEDNLKKAAPWKNYAARNSRLAKDALNKVQAAIRTGVLDPEKNTESIIAAESGWSGFTKDQYQRIVQLDSIINDPKQDDVTRREAMADLNKVISDAKLPVRFKDALGAYYVGNALMGIPTLTVNIASPIGFTVRNLMTDVSKFAFTDPARIPVAFETFMESMRSWYDQTSYAFKNQIYLNDVVEYLQGQNVLRELFDKGKKQWSEGKYAEGFVNMAVGMTQITGRVLSSLDQGAISMLENQNITRYALEALANTKGKVPKDKLKEFANMVIDTRRKTIAENIANGMSRDRAGVLADLAVKSEVISALAQYDVNPMNVLDASINDALQSVGRNKTLTIKGIEQSQKNISDEGFMSYWPIKLLEMVSAGAGREGSSMQIFAKMLYGFALVPARVFHNVAWFSPYGFIRLGVDKYKKNKGEDSPYAMSLQTEAQYRQRLTDSIAGSVAMLGLAALSSASTDEDEDKKFKIVITGNGPSATTDKQYFDSWMKKWKPYSVHIVVNGNIIPINIGRGGEALFFPIMLAGALDDWKIKQKQNLTKKEPEDLSAIAQMLGSSFFALAQRGPYAAFTKPLFDASKDGRVTEELASQAGFFGKTFIPVLGSSLSRNISDLFNDPVDRSSIEGAIYANTPVVGPWLGTKALNALGQPIRADDWGDKLFKLGVPVVFSFPKETPMNELNELILKQGSGPTIPTRANAQKRFGDVLTDKEFEIYVREYGRVMSDKMFKSRTKLANMKPADYDDELEKYARGYSIDGIKIKGASDSAVLAVKRMRQ